MLNVYKKASETLTQYSKNNFSFTTKFQIEITAKKYLTIRLPARLKLGRRFNFCRLKSKFLKIKKLFLQKIFKFGFAISKKIFKFF